MKYVSLGLLSAALLFGASESYARIRHVEVTPDRTKCMYVQYVPRLVEENTKGKLFRGESSSWQGAIVDGHVVRYVTTPAAYIKTTKVIEEEHHTLTPVACPAAGWTGTVTNVVLVESAD